MEVRLTSAAAPGRSVSEDYAMAYGDLVGVFDGVTQPQGFDSGCSHGPAWYVRRLAARLGAAYAATPSAPLPQLLADAIAAVQGDHEGSCDLSNPGTPASTACLLRNAGDRVEYLVLCDSTLVLDTGARISVVADERLGKTSARIHEAAVIPRAVAGTTQADRLPESTVEKHRYTNQPDGYWIAAANPRAAFKAITGEAPLHGPDRVRRAVLLTDGASCAVDRYNLFDWPALLDIVTDHGVTELIHRVRSAECSDPEGRVLLRHKRHDDATVALCIFGREQS